MALPGLRGGLLRWLPWGPERAAGLYALADCWAMGLVLEGLTRALVPRLPWGEAWDCCRACSLLWVAASSASTSSSSSRMSSMSRWPSSRGKLLTVSATLSAASDAGGGG